MNSMHQSLMLSFAVKDTVDAAGTGPRGHTKRAECNRWRPRGTGPTHSAGGAVPTPTASSGGKTPRYRPMKPSWATSRRARAVAVWPSVPGPRPVCTIVRSVSSGWPLSTLAVPAVAPDTRSTRNWEAIAAGAQGAPALAGGGTKLAGSPGPQEQQHTPRQRPCVGCEFAGVWASPLAALVHTRLRPDRVCGCAARQWCADPPPAAPPP